MFSLVPDPFIGFMAWFELAFLTVIIAVLGVKTGLAMSRGEICVED